MVISFFSLVLSCTSVLEIFGGGILNSVVELMVQVGLKFTRVLLDLKLEISKL